MKSFTLSLFTLVVSAFMAGCLPKAEEIAALGETVIVGPEYSASKGLYVPEDTRQSLGLKIVDVSEQKVAATLELSLRIYEIFGDSVRASGSVRPAQAEMLPVGHVLQIRTREGQTFTGKVAAVNAHIQELTGAVEVLVELPRTAEFVAGTFMNATAMVGTAGSVTAVPRSAVVQATDGDFVYTVSGKYFVRTPVTIGAFNAEFAEVKDGLYAGDQVVSEPAMSLWMTELAAVKGGHACCVVPAKGK